MSKHWWIVFSVLLGVGSAAVIVGISLYGTDSFIENMLPGAGVSLIVFAVRRLLLH